MKTKFKNKKESSK